MWTHTGIGRMKLDEENTIDIRCILGLLLACLSIMVHILGTRLDADQNFPLTPHARFPWQSIDKFQ